MSREIHRYQFKATVPADEIESTLLLAVLAVEGLHGVSRVRLEASYCFDAEKHACVIDTETIVGQDISRIFTGFSIREYGETAFRVERTDTTPKETEDVTT